MELLKIKFCKKFWKFLGILFLGKCILYRNPQVIINEELKNKIITKFKEKVSFLTFLLSVIFLTLLNPLLSFATEIRLVPKIGNNYKTIKNHYQLSQENDKKKLSFGINASFEQSNFYFDTPAAHSILKWREMKGYSIGGELKYKIFDFDDEFSNSIIEGSDVFMSYAFSKLKGEGTDDDVTNYNDSTISAFSVQKAKGKSHDLRLGTNIDIHKNNNFTSSLRLGGFYKELNFDMNDGNAIAIDYANSRGGNFKINGLGQRTKSKFTSMIIGGKISHESQETENVLIFDLYPAVYYRGDQLWPQRDPKDQNWSLESTNPGFGFQVALEHYFKISNQKLRIFSSYESITVKKLKESGDYYQVTGGTAQSSAKGRANFDSFKMGIGVYF